MGMYTEFGAKIKLKAEVISEVERLIESEIYEPNFWNEDKCNIYHFSERESIREYAKNFRASMITLKLEGDVLIAYGDLKNYTSTIEEFLDSVVIEFAEKIIFSYSHYEESYDDNFAKKYELNCGNIIYSNIDESTCIRLIKENNLYSPLLKWVEKNG